MIYQFCDENSICKHRSLWNNTVIKQRCSMFAITFYPSKTIHLHFLRRSSYGQVVEPNSLNAFISLWCLLSTKNDAMMVFTIKLAATSSLGILRSIRNQGICNIPSFELEFWLLPNTYSHEAMVRFNPPLPLLKTACEIHFEYQVV